MMDLQDFLESIEGIPVIIRFKTVLIKWLNVEPIVLKVFQL